MNPYLRAGTLACVLALPSAAWAQESPPASPAASPAAPPATPASPSAPAAAAVAVPPAEPPASPRRYTGHVLSIENLFGLHEMEETQEGRNGESRSHTYSSTGFPSILAPRLGYQYAAQSGLIGGFLLGMQRLRLTQEASSSSRQRDDDGMTTTLIELRPRIGYGVLQPGVGGWVRVGPNAMYVRSTGGSSYAISAGFDAGLVVSPIPRVGFLFGMGLDLAITGKSIPDQGDSRPYSNTTRSFTFGLVTVL